MLHLSEKIFTLSPDLIISLLLIGQEGNGDFAGVNVNGL